MKNKILILMTVFVSASAAHAEILLELSSGPGYVRREDEYSKDCVLNTDGKLEYTHQTGLNTEVAHWMTIVSQRKLSKLKRLIEEAQISPKYVDYQTGSGDLPGYSANAYSDCETHSFQIHDRGKDLTKNSSAARSIVREMSGLCGMKLEILKMKIFDLMGP